MSLFWPDDPKKIDLTTPRLHAFIVGVGDYPHLMSGVGHPAIANLGLQQLTTSVTTAKRIAQWLLEEYTNPSVPLGSIELLLSPSQPVIPPGSEPIAIDLATMEAVSKAFDSSWFPRCHAHQDNIAFFYFAGHGIRGTSQSLLMSDFGDPAKNNLWSNCIDFDGMRVGMFSNKADTQLFFVDACRETPIDALVYKNPTGNPLVTASVFDRTPMSAVYYAAAEGLQAYGPQDDVTFFATALLEALGGAGAVKKNGKWIVDTYMLGTGLGHVMNVLAAEHNQMLSCQPMPSRLPVAIHYPSTPRIRASIGCRTIKANQESLIEVQQGAKVLRSETGAQRPWKGQLELDDCTITMSFHTFPTVVCEEKIAPPIFEFEVDI
jgi:hypothetical protein